MFLPEPKVWLIWWIQFKRQRIHSDILSFSNEEYLCLLACGFICSSGVSRSVFDNDFLNNLCYSLRWQAPSLYVVQKKITDFSKLIRSRIEEFLCNQSSISLIVYPWMDISKRFSLSYLACTSTGVITFLSTSHYSQESWSNTFIFQNIQNVIRELRQKHIYVRMILYDELSFFGVFRTNFYQLPEFKSISFIGNMGDCLKDGLSTIFTHPSLLNMKQYVWYDHSTQL